VLAAYHRHPHRAVQPGQVLIPEPPGQMLAYPHPHHAATIVDLVVQRAALARYLDR
jgi:hypothetical protein